MCFRLIWLWAVLVDLFPKAFLVLLRELVDMKRSVRHSMCVLSVEPFRSFSLRDGSFSIDPNRTYRNQVSTVDRYDNQGKY